MTKKTNNMAHFVVFGKDCPTTFLQTLQTDISHLVCTICQCVVNMFHKTECKRKSVKKSCKFNTCTSIRKILITIAGPLAQFVVNWFRNCNSMNCFSKIVFKFLSHRDYSLPVSGFQLSFVWFEVLCPSQQLWTSLDSQFT